MVEILPLVERILAALLNALGLLGVIQGQTQHAAIETAPLAIETIASNATNAIDNPDYGLAAIAARLDALTSNGEYALANVLAVTGTPQQANDPVTLPDTPPPAYGGASGTEAAAAVWSYEFSERGTNAESAIDEIFDFARSGRTMGFIPFAGNRLFGILNGNIVEGESGGDLPVLDVSLADANVGETRMEFVTRTLPSFDWRQDWSTNPPYFEWDWGDNWVFIGFTLGEAEFQNLVRQQHATGATVPPVWPGLAGVTLLPAVTIVTPGGVIDTPMDGCIVEITGHPSWAGSYDFGGVTSWRNCGALAFADDDAQEEAPQTLGMTPCIYCPKTMATAGGLVYRVATGYAGTITPWRVLS